jgi:hypothetical protein
VEVTGYEIISSKIPGATTAGANPQIPPRPIRRTRTDRGYERKTT